MRASINKKQSDEILGYVKEDGKLLLAFSDHRAPTQRVCVINTDGVVHLNGTSPLDDISPMGRIPIRKGDKVTLQF